MASTGTFKIKEREKEKKNRDSEKIEVRDWFYGEW